MGGEPRCTKCGEPVSLERGITAVGDLNAPGMDYYCEACEPNRGKGYTLADLERWHEDGQIERAKYELARFRDDQHTMANLAEAFGDGAKANADELFRAKSQDQP